MGVAGVTTVHHALWRHFEGLGGSVGAFPDLGHSHHVYRAVLCTYGNTEYCIHRDYTAVLVSRRDPSLPQHSLSQCTTYNQVLCISAITYKLQEISQTQCLCFGRCDVTALSEQNCTSDQILHLTSPSHDDGSYDACYVFNVNYSHVTAGDGGICQSSVYDDIGLFNSSAKTRHCQVWQYEDEQKRATMVAEVSREWTRTTMFISVRMSYLTSPSKPFLAETETSYLWHPSCCWPFTPTLLLTFDAQVAVDLWHASCSWPLTRKLLLTFGTHVAIDRTTRRMDVRWNQCHRQCPYNVKFFLQIKILRAEFAPCPCLEKPWMLASCYSTKLLCGIASYYCPQVLNCFMVLHRTDVLKY